MEHGKNIDDDDDGNVLQKKQIHKEYKENRWRNAITKFYPGYDVTMFGVWWAIAAAITPVYWAIITYITIFMDFEVFSFAHSWIYIYVQVYIVWELI